MLRPSDFVATLGALWARPVISDDLHPIAR
jgi:hypothetical protein